MSAGSNTFLACAAAIAAALSTIVVTPLLFNEYEVLQMTIYVILAILALSLAFIWGIGGILSFGHAAFFGLGAYSYSIAAINFGETSAAVVMALLVPALFAALLGYFMFYGRIGDVYLGAITLTVTLILYKVVNSTSGSQYKIGKAAIGGFNGIPSVPMLSVPGFPDWPLSTGALFSLSVVLLAGTYILLRLLVLSDFGRIVIGVRENERRAELLGYDVRRYKLLTFVIGAVIAGMAGCLYANWGNYTDPSVFALSQSVQVIIWVVVGGLGTFVGPVIGCFALQWLTTYLGTVDIINRDIALGAILTLAVLVLPRGFAPSMGLLLRRFVRTRRIGQEVVS